MGDNPFPCRVEADLMRLALTAAILGRFFRFLGRAKGLLDTPRRRWLLLSRFADDCRLLPLRFECLAKFVRLRI